MDDLFDVESITDVDVDVESEIDIDVDVEECGPQGKDGLSAYEIYLKNGGILTETEWLSTLKGEPGVPGKDGSDGKTPIRGEDYWTEEDINVINTYCNNYIDEQLGVIENGSY